MAATWQQVRQMLAPFGTMVSDDIMRLDINVGAGRSQKVMISHDSLGPYEIIGIYSAFSSVLRSDALAALLPYSATSEADVAPLVQQEGQALITGLGYLPDGDSGLGHFYAHNVLPLDLLDLSDGVALMVYIRLVARFADQLEQKYAKQYGKTDTHDQF